MYNQLPYATMLAINKTAEQVKDNLKSEMKRVFDRPTSFTINSLYIKRATKSKLIAEIKLKDEPGKGTAAAEYLQPQIISGKRKRKRSEMWLSDKGILSNTGHIVPGKGMKLNKSGNITSGKMTQILSAVGAHPDKYSNTSKHSRKKNTRVTKIFAISEGSNSHLKPGIYERYGKGKLRSLLYFVKGVTYKRILYYHEIADITIKANINENMLKAIDNAIKTAK
jgi:hypothetical protein